MPQNPHMYITKSREELPKDIGDVPSFSIIREHNTKIKIRNIDKGAIIHSRGKPTITGTIGENVVCWEYQEGKMAKKWLITTGGDFKEPQVNRSRFKFSKMPEKKGDNEETNCCNTLICALM